MRINFAGTISLGTVFSLGSCVSFTPATSHMKVTVYHDMIRDVS